MRQSLKDDFGTAVPCAVVVDDNANSRRALVEELRERGFRADGFRSPSDFLKDWKPGMVDVIIADWELSKSERGDKLLAAVRARDWDVPFVLISGKLSEVKQREKVVETLLSNGGTRFVPRGGAHVYDKTCDVAEDLMERRDSSLLSLILSLRPAVQDDAEIRLSSGSESVQAILADVVKTPAAIRDLGRAVPARRAARAKTRLAGRVP